MSADNPLPGETRQQWADRMLADWQRERRRGEPPATITPMGLAALHRAATGTCAGAMLARKMIERGIGADVTLPN